MDSLAILRPDICSKMRLLTEDMLCENRSPAKAFTEVTGFRSVHFEACFAVVMLMTTTHAFDGRFERDVVSQAYTLMMSVLGQCR